jgi:hypothetical protein
MNRSIKVKAALLVLAPQRLQAYSNLMNFHKDTKWVNIFTLAIGAAMLLSSSFVIAQANFSTVFEKVEKSVVVIKGDTGLGSGFIISADGKIATNLHVIRGTEKGGVQLNNGEIFDSFTVLGIDVRRDLAVIKVGGFNLPALELGDSDQIKIGEPIAVIGSPRGLSGTVTTGVVSSIRTEDGVKLLQIDAAVNPGNSGGPVIKMDGSVIAVVVSKLTNSENINFSIPINSLRGLMGNLTQPITLAQLRDDLKDQTDLFKSKKEIFPKEWKSLTSSNSRRLNISNDFITGENHIPPDALRNGVYSRWDIKKVDDKWVGKMYSRGSCFVPAGFFAEKWNKHDFIHDVELTLVTTTRIEGRLRTPSGKFDCSSGKWDKPAEWLNFIWVPVN